MNKKTAHYLAKLAARETYINTLKKLAQSSEYVQPGEGGSVEHVKEEVTKERPDYDREKNTGGEVLHDSQTGGGMNRPDYGSESLFGGNYSDDEMHADDEHCAACGAKKEKKASAKSSLMKVAEKYAKKTRK